MKQKKFNLDKLFSSFKDSPKKLKESWKNSKIYKGVHLIKIRLIQLHDKLRTEDINKMSGEVEKITPYLYVVRWFLDIMLYGFFITLVACTVFRVPFAPLLVLGTGLLRWLVFDSIAEYLKTTKGN